MKKILLVKPHYHHIPIGMAYVLATLEEQGLPFTFIDLSRTSLDLGQELASGDYYAVAAGGLVSDYAFIYEFVRASKAAAPQLPFILGGNITSCLSDELLFDRLGIDYAVLGEAETALPGLLRCLGAYGDRPTPPVDVPGVCFRDAFSGAIRRNKPAPLDLQAHDPRPAWHLIDHAFYLARSKHHAFAPGQTFLPILTGRGCSGHCSFCNPTLGRFRPRLVENIFDEMQKVAEKFTFDVYNFATEVFFAKEGDILDFCAQYTQRGFQKQWFCSLRIDVGPTVLQAMKKAGCIGVSIGFESASDPILKRMNKGITASQGRAFVRAAKELGLPLECNIMVGNEGETMEDIQASFNMMSQERVDANVNLTVAYHGTAIFRRAVERGAVACEHEQALGEKYCGLYTPDMAAYRYLNISGFPSLKELHRAVMAEYRAHTGSLLDHYASKPVLRVQGEAVDLFWKCRACGGENDINATWRQFDGLVRRRFCGHCRAFSYVHLLPQRVREAAAEKLAGQGRILLCGAGVNAQSLWAYPLEGLDMDRINAVADPAAEWDANSTFYFLPRMSLAQAATRMPDILVSVDRDLDYNAQPALAAFTRGAPEMLHLTPHLFPEGLLEGRRVLFVGGFDAHALPPEYLDQAVVAGVIGGDASQGEAAGLWPAAFGAVLRRLGRGRHEPRHLRRHAGHGQAAPGGLPDGPVWRKAGAQAGVQRARVHHLGSLATARGGGQGRGAAGGPDQEAPGQDAAVKPSPDNDARNSFATARRPHAK